MTKERIMVSATFCKQHARLTAAFGLLLLLVVPVLAQGSQFICRDETDHLNCARIEAAARPLLDRGAAVAIYMVNRGDSSGADFLARLHNDRLANDDLVDPDLVAIYVSLDPHYAELRGGDHWNAALLPNDNITTIRKTKLVPSLAAGAFTAGYIDTLQAIEGAIASPPQPVSAMSPPVAGDGGNVIAIPQSATPAPPRVAADDGNAIAIPLSLSILGVAALGAVGYAALRWRKAHRALAETR